MNQSTKQILYNVWRKVNKGWNKGEAFRCLCGDPIVFHTQFGKFHWTDKNKEHKIRPVSWCLPAALEHTVKFDYYSDNYQEALSALYKALARRTKKRADYDALVKWNDSKRRTKEEVLSLIQEARRGLQ